MSGAQELDRRQFIAGGAVGVVAALAGVEAKAGSQISVLLHDPRIPMPDDVQQRFDAIGTQVVALEGDPVWFWRSKAGEPLRNPATQLMGVTGWAELLVFRGLAAETRRHLRYEKLAASGTFIWMIA
jgi:hypothetical protein